jgi:hypothetical protein
MRLLASGGDFRIPLGGLRSGDRSSEEEFRRMSPLRLALATLRSGDRSSEEELWSADLAEGAVTGLWCTLEGSLHFISLQREKK